VLVFGHTHKPWVHEYDRRPVRAVFEHDEDPAPWGSHQPRFDRLEYEGSRRFFLVGRLASGDPIRIRLTSGRYEPGSTSSR
jgi:hypothetical protein